MPSMGYLTSRQYMHKGFICILLLQKPKTRINSTGHQIADLHVIRCSMFGFVVRLSCGGGDPGVCQLGCTSFVMAVMVNINNIVLWSISLLLAEATHCREPKTCQPSDHVTKSMHARFYASGYTGCI